MRVTSNLYPEVFKSQLQNLQQRQLLFQNQISTGVSVIKSSDDPVAFRQSQRLASDQAKMSDYLSSTNEAKAIQQSNFNAVTDTQRVLTRISEIGIRGNGALDSQALQALSSEVSSLVDQLVTVANRQHNGNYLFGGTGNVEAVDSTTGPNYVFNATSSSNVTQAKVNDGAAVDTGIVTGRGSNDNPPTTVNFRGFLIDSTVNTMVVVKDIRDTLAAGNPISEAQLGTVNDAINLAAEFVGRTASQLAATDLNEASLKDGLKNGSERMDKLTAVNMVEAVTELQRTQTHYQAALQSGAKILNISLLDFIR